MFFRFNLLPWSDPEAQQQGLEPAGGPPEEFVSRLRADVAKWKKVVKEAHITINK